ncbi:MAG: hypothetical protein L6R37_006285 [Teloschistes peruensis]|nr:MAG: hypothetical protein L6R37_006285 [Teloschistes peruensis]
MVRPNRPELKKAGNLRHAFSETTGQFFTVFDADFCPRPEFLLETIPYMMTDPNRAILQTPQYFRSTPEQTWVEQGTGAMLENYYRVMQVSREEWGVSMCAGSNAIYRRTALEPVGGTIPVAHSEDNYTGVYVVSAGWTIKYILLRPRLRQQPGHAHRLFQPKNALKFCYAIGFYGFGIAAARAFLIPLPTPVFFWTRPDLLRPYILFFAVPTMLNDLVAMRTWLRIRWTMGAQYVVPIASYAYIQSIYDYFFGTEIAWTPSNRQGGWKTYHDRRYRNMWVLAIVWTIAHNCALVAVCVYRLKVLGMYFRRLCGTGISCCVYIGF